MTLVLTTMMTVMMILRMLACDVVENFATAAADGDDDAILKGTVVRCLSSR